MSKKILALCLTMFANAPIPNARAASDSGDYSSIAYSESTGGGSIVACTTQEEAHPAALAKCEAHGYSDCKVVLTTANSAVAIARGSSDHRVYGLGYGTSKLAAKNLAITNCRKYDRACKIVGAASNCADSRYIPPATNQQLPPTDRQNVSCTLNGFTPPPGGVCCDGNIYPSPNC